MRPLRSTGRGRASPLTRRSALGAAAARGTGAFGPTRGPWPSPWPEDQHPTLQSHAGLQGPRRTSSLPGTASPRPCPLCSDGKRALSPAASPTVARKSPQQRLPGPLRPGELAQHEDQGSVQERLRQPPPTELGVNPPAHLAPRRAGGSLGLRICETSQWTSPQPSLSGLSHYCGDRQRGEGAVGRRWWRESPHLPRAGGCGGGGCSRPAGLRERRRG